MRCNFCTIFVYATFSVQGLVQCYTRIFPSKTTSTFSYNNMINLAFKYDCTALFPNKLLNFFQEIICKGNDIT